MKFLCAVLELICAVATVVVLALVLLTDVTPIPCQLANLVKPDFAGQAAKHVVEVPLGTLDFRALAPDYDRICILEVADPGEHYGIPGLDPRLSKLIGQKLCHGWERDSVWFALIKESGSGSSFAILRRQFARLPPGRPPQNADAVCAPTQSAVARCTDRGPNGIHCIFPPS